MTFARFLVASLALAFSIGPFTLGAQTSSARLFERVSSALEAKEADLIAVRRDLHRHPEVSLQEKRTAGVVAARLKALKLDVREGVGGYGVLGVLRGGQPGPVIAFRADMDAVPSNDPDPVDFRSVNPGVRHICGHDVHTTVGLALAEALSSIRDDLQGTVVFVFQPAEERVVGARAMLDAGIFNTNRPAAIFAVHTAPFPVGQLGTTPGTMMAWRDRVAVSVTGSGNLAAIADSVRRAIQSVGTISFAEAVRPMAPGFIFAQTSAPRQGAGGDWTVEGSISVATDASSDQARAAILKALDRLGSVGVTLKPTYEKRQIPGVTNDSALSVSATAAIQRVLGPESIVQLNTIPPAFSEDYGAFQAQVPGVFYFLGVGPIGMPHTPGYVADEKAIVIGAKAMAAAMLERMSQH